MDSKSCSKQISQHLGNLGVRPGNTVMVHSSFKSLGFVPGGIETLVQGFLDAIGPDGTLLMPALSWSLRPPEVFDVRATGTNVGAVPEYFRNRNGVTRSVHPTHSVCATGPRTHEFIDDHWQDASPCGVHSPFRKISETEGKIVMLGCGLRPNTTMHALEECAEAPYVRGPSYRFTITNHHGDTYQKEYWTHGFSARGYAQRYDRVAELDAPSLLSEGKVLHATTFVLDAPTLKRAVLAKLETDPFSFVETMSG